VVVGRCGVVVIEVMSGGGVCDGVSCVEEGVSFWGGGGGGGVFC